VSAAVVDIAFRRRAMNTAVQSPPAQAARDAERMAREIGDRWFLAIAIADLAHVVIAQGRLDEAADIVRRDRHGSRAQRPGVADQATCRTRQARGSAGARRARRR